MQDSNWDIASKLKNPRLKSGVFNELVAEYQKPLYYHIRRMVGNHHDADDVLQNTFLKVWKYADKFKGESAIYTWLYRIASNEALSHLNGREKHRSAGLEDYQHPSSEHREVTESEIERKLEKALLTLPPKQRQVFDLKYFSDLSYNEIAEITETSVGALKASYFHAVKKIELSLKVD